MRFKARTTYNIFLISLMPTELGTLLISVNDLLVRDAYTYIAGTTFCHVGGLAHVQKVQTLQCVHTGE